MGNAPAQDGFFEGMMEGLSVGPEEHKLGIKGSSTCQVFFEDCKVPVENLLGEIGKGHLIAFNILNIGRLKLCAATLGGAKRSSTISVAYANERKQFKQSISSFGAIQAKLAEQAIRIFACESALYRTSNYINEKRLSLKEAGATYGEALLGAAKEYAVECAILKVFGSEVLDFVSDEAVQIHGGMGYSEELPVAMAYRDSRINRIFEGTNEINRLLIIDMLLKSAMSGELDLLGPAKAIQSELMSVPDLGSKPEGAMDQVGAQIGNLKKAVLMVAGAAAQKLGKNMQTEQEIVMHAADMIITVYVAESMWLRCQKQADHQDAGLRLDMLQVFVNDRTEQLRSAGQNAISAFAEGDELKLMMLGLKRFTKLEVLNTKEARRRIAAKLIEANQYCF